MSTEATFTLFRKCNEVCRSNPSSCNEPAMTLLPARTLDSNIGNILGRDSGHTLCHHQTKASLLVIKGCVDWKHAVAHAVLHLCRRQIPWEWQNGVRSQAIPFPRAEEFSLFIQSQAVYLKSIGRLLGMRTLKALRRDRCLSRSRCELRGLAAHDIIAALCMRRLYLDLVGTFYSLRQPKTAQSTEIRSYRSMQGRYFRLVYLGVARWPTRRLSLYHGVALFQSRLLPRIETHLVSIHFFWSQGTYRRPRYLWLEPS